VGRLLCRKSRALVLALGVCGTLAIPANAGAEDAPFIEWSSLLPSAMTGYRASTFSDCANASPKCIDATLREMRRRYNRMASRCDDNAIFQMTYIWVTERYRRAALDGGYISEPDFLAREDKSFAVMYFNAYNAWAAGQRDRVPRAWLWAFDTARAGSVNALGNVLQGINAHVNRDMPFMLAGLGLVKPDGSSRKPDHDRFNRLLNNVYDEVIDEIAKRFDPTAKAYDLPGTQLDNTAIFQLLPLWREGVWRNAEMLVRTRGTPMYAQVAKSIEDYAATQASDIAWGFHDSPSQAAAKKAWCRAHGRAPLTKPFIP
jgi:hypothetical protein